MLWAEKHLSIHNTSLRQMELHEKWKITLGYTHVSQGKKSETAAAKICRNRSFYNKKQIQNWDGCSIRYFQIDLILLYIARNMTVILIADGNFYLFISLIYNH